METTSSHCGDITGGGADKKSNQSESILTQPTANGMLPHQKTEEAPPPLSDRSEDGDLSDDSVTGSSSSTNDIAPLLPQPPAAGQRKHTGVDTSSEATAPVCAPPPLQSSSCHHHHHQSTNQKRLSSSKGPASLKTDAAHIKEVAGDDCCVHCLLACLFCELLSMCSAVGECLACAVGGVSCCDAAVGCCSCCVEAACTEEACQAVLDCGILQDCCGSSDCLDICLECCSICFPS
ncbi:hypothetical protein JOB18_005756 [Solea senegalensis]|uniref:MyoD family inhibitor domain containing n=1 Tax=Solea senegalensis TaxID=28829 RepID=A0AAV6SQI3_SOLSE|nr:myoD family inhibitor domain-containing protein isoform X2 [Solea senegalensis]KAG7519315.1 hypothetical protein JOB18_005756 [Solea senegalensis]